MRMTGLRGFVAFLLALAITPAYALVCTSLSSGNWNSSSSWSCGHVPANDDSVVVAHDVTLNTDTAKLSGLTINSGKSLSSTMNRLISLNGSLTNNGTISVPNGRIELSSNSTWGGSGLLSLSYVDQKSNALALELGSTLTIRLSSGTPLRGAEAAGFNSSLNRTATVVLNGAAQTIPSDSVVYPNLTLTGGGTKSHSGSTLKILGTLSIDSGTRLTAVDTVELGGDLVINGTLSATGWGWTFNGSTLQTISASASFMRMTVSNPQGISLGGNLTIGDTNTGDLSLLAGKISTGAYRVIIPRPCGDNWLTTRAPGSWINGNLTLTAPYYGATCVFHVGDDSNYAPIKFAYAWGSSAGGTVTGRTSFGDHPDTRFWISGIDVTKSVNRYWTLTPNTGSFNPYSATFQYCNSSGSADCGINDVDSGANPSNFVVAKKTGSTWTTYSPSAPTSTSRQVSGLSAFGDFAIGEKGGGPTCLTDNFASGLNSTLWNVAGTGSGFTPQVVASPTVSSSRLRLTDNQKNRSTFAQLKKWFPAANNRVVVEFDYFGWGGSGADGVAVVLSDASVPPSPGGYGGSLGYANRDGVNGFNGGWLGIGIDEYGNYPNSTETRRGYPSGYTPPPGANIGAGAYASSVAVRGSGSGQSSGYALLANTGTLTPALTTTSSKPQRYRIVVDHSNSINAYVSVERDTGSGFAMIVPAFDVKSANSGQSTIPTNMLLSFTGSTGDSTNNHEIGNVKVCATSMSNVGNSNPAANFECLETREVSTWTTTGRKPLYTKLTDTDFKFDVVALKADGTIENGYVAAGGDPKLVRVELFDDRTSPSPACSDYTSSVAWQPLTYVSGDGGRKTISNNFNLDKAWGKLRCRVTDANATQTVYGCSSDTFTVRPQVISSVSSSANVDASGTSASATPVVRAGTSFSITAGTNKVGYGGTPKIDTAKIAWAGMPSGGALGTLGGSFKTAASPSTGNGATGSAFSYSEVGYFRLLAQGVFDDTFTTISSDATSSDCTDDFSNTPVDGKYGCKFGTKTATDYFGRFVPDHFTSVGAVDSTCVSGTTFPTYMEQPFTLSRSGTTSKAELVEAQNVAGDVTKNYSGSYAKGVVTFGAENADNGTDLSSRLVFANAPSPALSGSWGSGIYTLTENATSVMFKRPTASSPDATWGPFDTLDIGLTVKDTDVSASATISGADMNPGVAGGTSFSYKKFSGTPLLMRYGRLRLLNANGSSILDLPIAMRTEYWKSATNGWQVNSADICTKATLSFSPVDSFDTSKTCVWDTGTAPGNSGMGCTSSTAPSGKQFKEAGVTGFVGDFNLWLKAPNVGGALDVTVTDVPGWLKFNWAGTVDKPTARATFGISKSGKVIHLREMY